jgi:cobalt-zinc-cadmium resistance protein CzcA
MSLYGLSNVKLQFSFNYTYDEALQQVLNRLSQLAPLPGNVLPGHFAAQHDQRNPPLPRARPQDAAGPALQRRFRAAPGVIDVTGWGGRPKALRAAVDLNKLVAKPTTLPQLTRHSA